MCFSFQASVTDGCARPIGNLLYTVSWYKNVVSVTQVSFFLGPFDKKEIYVKDENEVKEKKVKSKFIFFYVFD